MSIKNISNQAIALAGLAQSCAMVQQLATTGKVDDESALEASVGSILKVDADSVADVYGGLSHIRYGLNELEKQITGRSIANQEQARYAACLVFLEKELANRPEMIDVIHKGIERAQKQSEHFGLMHENVLANLADLYHSTVSTIPPRIMVNGSQEYLSNTLIVNKIRSSLLAGVRSVMLWRQCGGARWKFLFFRKKLQDEVHFLLTQA